MCGRFYVEDDEKNELLAALIREASRRREKLTGEAGIATGEVLPSATVAALAVGKTGQGAYPMQWGFTRPGGKGLLINVRSETALEKPMFRESMLRRRCLIPASWYFEWQAAEEGRGKTKFAIRPRKDGLMYLAAIYRYEENRRLPVLSILTRDAAPGIAFIHPRMPVIFSEKARDAWLDGSAEPGGLLRACETDMACRTEPVIRADEA